MNILGIHTSYTALSHDPSACLIKDGEVVAAIEEERLNRIKTSSTNFPERAIKACLDIGELNINDIDMVVSDGVTYPELDTKIDRSMNHNFGNSPRIEIVNHAYAHSAGAFCSSGFDESLVVSVDGLGDKLSTLVCTARQAGSSVEFEELYRADRAHSLGNFYTAFTNYLGFRSIEGEYKVMGMAAYGVDKYDLSELLYFDSKTGAVGSHAMDRLINVDYYTAITEPVYDQEYIYKLTKVARPIYSDSGVNQDHFDLAASVQAQFQRTYIGLIKHYLKKTKSKKLCLAGGCALNCLANRDLLEEGLDDIYIMPAASDRGLSMGSAMYAGTLAGEEIHPVKNMFLGKSYGHDKVKEALDLCGLSYSEIENPFADCARSIADGLVVGWFQGRSEFGPRALGHRSILANAKKKNMKNILNAKIKFRETFRPFAPAILEADFADYYDSKMRFPYMTFTVDMPDKLAVHMPEATHLDGTARIQSVVPEDSESFSTLLSEVKGRLDIGAVINTSFNLAGEPIVDSPFDAIRTFYSSGIDVLYLENFKLEKTG
jgi:carbamoyltransferase